MLIIKVKKPNKYYITQIKNQIDEKAHSIHDGYILDN